MIIENCENCKYFKPDSIDIRRGHCLNKASGWNNMPRMDVHTCGDFEQISNNESNTKETENGTLLN